MRKPKVIWVTHSQVTEEEIQKAVSLEIDGIQLRCKELSTDKLLGLAKAARVATSEAGKDLIINSSIEIAIEVGADGVHFPEAMIDSIEPSWPLQVSVSIHSLKAAKDAQSKRASFVAFGPIFETPSKKAYGVPQGLSKLKEVVKNVSIPIYAIGGINFKMIETCFNCGVCGVMMQRSIQRLLCQ